MADIVINVASQGQEVPSTVWGTATGALIDNQFALAVDQNFQAAAKQLDFQLLRFNALAGGNAGLWNQQIFGSNPNAPNFTWMNNWFAGSPKFWNNNHRLICGIGPNSFDTNLDPNYWATAVTQMANYFRQQGQECFWWECGNEPNGLDLNGYCAVFNAMADALHNVNPNYKIGGPVSAGLDQGYMSGWAQQCGNKAGFVTWHVYTLGGGGSDAGSAYASAYNGGSGAGGARSYMGGTAAANLPLFVGEYSTSYNCNDGMMSTVSGAIFNALLLQDGYDSDSLFTMGGNWETAFDGSCGLWQNGLTPQGWYLGIAGQLMGGFRAATTINVAANIKVLATVNGQTWACQIINFDLGTPLTLSLQIQNNTPSNMFRWEISDNFPSGQSFSLTSLNSISVPANSVVIVHGSLGNGQPGPAPTPSPTPTPAPPPSPAPSTTESGDGTTIPPSDVIVGSDGTNWGMTSGGQVTVNGAIDTTTANVIKMAYVNRLVYQENNQNLWWNKSVPSDTWSPPAGDATDPTASVAPPPAPAPSPTPPPTPTPPPSPPPAPVPPPAPPPAPAPAPPPPPPPTRNYYDNPGGDGSAGTPGGASIWVTPLGDQAAWGVDTNSDTIDLRKGGAINSSHSYGDVLWVAQPTDPFTTFISPNDAYQRDSGLAATVHCPVGAYPPGPQAGATFGRNVFNVIDPMGNPDKTWSFVGINVTSITGGQTVFATYAETDDPTSDHYGEDQETRNFGYDRVAGLLTAYDFGSSNPNFPRIQHMLAYLHDPQFLKSGDPNGSDTLPASCWPQLKQDAQNITPYSGNLVAGTTVGIPLNIAMPDGLTSAGQIIFWTLQHYGALWRGTCQGGFTLCAMQDVGDAILSDINKDLPSIVQYLCPMRNQHQFGQSWSTFPKNAPGNRADTPLLLTSSTPSNAPPPTPVPIASGTLSPLFAEYWQALTEELTQKNADLLYGFVINSGDPQGASGKPDQGVLNTPAVSVIGTNLAHVQKG